MRKTINTSTLLKYKGMVNGRSMSVEQAFRRGKLIIELKDGTLAVYNLDSSSKRKLTKYSNIAEYYRATNYEYFKSNSVDDYALENLLKGAFSSVNNRNFVAAYHVE